MTTTPNQDGVAEGDLPGKVIPPNAGLEEFVEGGQKLGNFGIELEKPGFPAPPVKPGEDHKRFEYWQSEAQKAQEKAKQLEAQLLEKAKMDPLIELVQNDEESYRFLRARLEGKRTPANQLPEAPQRPDSYNEVEAYSNPESASFKYRLEESKYKDKMLQAVIQQNAALYQQREEERRILEQQRSNEESLRRFRSEILSRGVSNEEFPDFFKLVNEASVDDMVGYWNYKKGKQPETTQQDPQRFAMFPQRSVMLQTKPGERVDIGKEFKELASRMY